jgi:hypothetical protein
MKPADNKWYEQDCWQVLTTLRMSGVAYLDQAVHDGH